MKNYCKTYFFDIKSDDKIRKYMLKYFIIHSGVYRCIVFATYFNEPAYTDDHAEKTASVLINNRGDSFHLMFLSEESQ